MAADCFGQAVPQAEKVDGGGVAVVIEKNRNLGLLLRLERVIDTSDGSNLPLPGKFVGVILRERRPNETAFCGLAMRQGMRLVAQEGLSGRQGKIRRVAPPPAKSQGVNKSLRCCVRSRPKSSAKAKMAMEYLFSRPRPAITPNGSQSFGFCV